ncbi:sulfatase family protein [Aureliella helgolandensis]|uniref:Arylsulfatase n=1 Tax=Aureliella helgolandensis TaxID=2527968 RepID=A0A518G7L8_9BACT|nr:sulfatase [Aureliella helgolandensis]QDV24586.1 Arylsulfatase [Aureliella helgolandensis]
MSRCASMLFLWGLLTCGAVSGQERPNFVIFVADDMAWEDSGAYGHPHIRTPNLDNLADAGIRFDQAYLTCSSCSPSRCSILTGRYPHATGAGELHLPLPADAQLLTSPLGQAGYWTAAVGKWHLGGAVVDQVSYRRDSRPEAMGQAWVEALQSRPRDQPFFLWAAHTDPHRPYASGTIEIPHEAMRDVVVPPFLPDEPEVRRDLALYYDEIARFDEHVGMVLAELESQGVSQNTFVLVLSDNGRPFPSCKTRVTIPGVRTPFLVRWPAKIGAGRTSQQLVSSVDIAPTILELAGIEPLATFQGESFVDLLDSATAEIRTEAFAEHNWHDYQAFERSVLTTQYCYVRNWLPQLAGTPPADAVTGATFRKMQELKGSDRLTAFQLECFESPRPEEFLFDSVLDPNCLVNLAQDARFAAVLAEMRAKLAGWQMETEDAFPGQSQLTPDGFDRESGKRLINAAHPSLQKK